MVFSVSLRIPDPSCPPLPSPAFLAPPLSGLEEPLEAAGGTQCTRGQVCPVADDVTQPGTGIGAS